MRRSKHPGVYMIRLHRWVCDACYKQGPTSQETCPGPWHKKEKESRKEGDGT